MDYDDEVVGDVMGDDGEYAEVVGAGRLKLPRGRGRMIRLPAKQAWRRQLAPGVPMPGTGLEPLPMSPTLNDGIFTDVFPAIEFVARPQQPFRAERLIALVRRSAGATAARIQSQAIFVGTSLMQAEVGAIDLEVFAPGAFGVRLKLVQAAPGVLIRMIVSASPAVPIGETVALSLLFLGRTVR